MSVLDNHILDYRYDHVNALKKKNHLKFTKNIQIHLYLYYLFLIY